VSFKVVLCRKNVRNQVISQKQDMDYKASKLYMNIRYYHNIITHKRRRRGGQGATAPQVLQKSASLEQIFWKNNRKFGQLFCLLSSTIWYFGEYIYSSPEFGVLLRPCHYHYQRFYDTKSQNSVISFHAFQNIFGSLWNSKYFIVVGMKPRDLDLFIAFATSFCFFWHKPVTVEPYILPVCGEINCDSNLTFLWSILISFLMGHRMQPVGLSSLSSLSNLACSMSIFLFDNILAFLKSWYLQLAEVLWKPLSKFKNILLLHDK